MFQVILCIDDEPIRYNVLATQARRYNVIVLVTCRLEDVKFYLERNDIYEMIGICLDHDMPNQPNGEYYAQHILNEKNIPIVIASMNQPGALNIKGHLDEYETPNILLPIKDTENWARDAMAFFVRHQGSDLPWGNREA